MFGKSLIPYEPIAPAETMIDGATSDASCPGFKLVQTGASFTSSVKEGDLVIHGPGTAGAKSAYVIEVENDTTLLLDENLEFDSDDFDIRRPSELSIRPPELVEWVLRSIRTGKGDQVNRIGMWFSDGFRKVLVLDTKRLYTEKGFDLSSDDPTGFWMENLDLFVTNEKEILIRNCCDETADVIVMGINKTVDIGDQG